MTDTETATGQHPHEELLRDVAGVLSSVDEVQDYLDRVVHAVRRHVTGCDEVGITLLVDGRPSTAAYTTVATLEIDAVQYQLDEGPCLEAARERTEVVAALGEGGVIRTDEGRLPITNAFPADELDELNEGNIVAFPLAEAQRVLGHEDALTSILVVPEDGVELADLRGTGAEIVVIEDGPADPRTAQLAAEHGARHVALGAPRGLNVARNAAVEAARADLLHVRDGFFEQRPRGREHDHRHRLVDKCDRPVLHLARSVALGVDVADFFQF